MGGCFISDNHQKPFWFNVSPLIQQATVDLAEFTFRERIGFQYPDESLSRRTSDLRTVLMRVTNVTP